MAEKAVSDHFQAERALPWVCFPGFVGGIDGLFFGCGGFFLHVSWSD
jgi:hypothetical protein